MASIYDIMNEKIIIHLGRRDIEINFYDIVMPCSALSIFYFLFWRKSGFNDANNLKELRKQSVTEEDPDDVPYKPQDIVSKQ